VQPRRVGATWRAGAERPRTAEFSRGRYRRALGNALAVVDAGPLYAVADADDRDHDVCLESLAREDLRLVVPALAIVEATYFVGKRVGAHAESAFLRGVAQLDIEAPSREDLLRMAELTEQYADFPLGGTDASVIALAERLETDTIITLDRRHLAAVAPLHRKAFVLLP